MAQPIRFSLRNCHACRQPFAGGGDGDLCAVCQCRTCWACLVYSPRRRGHVCPHCRRPPPARGPSAGAPDGRPLFP